MKQANIAKELVESFGYEPKLTELTASDAWGMTKDAATSNFAKTAGVGAVAGKAASKILGRAIPGVGIVIFKEGKVFSIVFNFIKNSEE